MDNIDNLISIGQDCSTLMFIRQSKKHMPSFFDRLAIYSSGYTKFLNKNFL